MEHRPPVSVEAKALQSLLAGGPPGRAGHLIDGHRLHVPCEGRQPVGPYPPGLKGSNLTCTPNLSDKQSLALRCAPAECSTSRGPGWEMHWGRRCKHPRLRAAACRAGDSCVTHAMRGMADRTDDSCHLPAVGTCLACAPAPRQCSTLITRHPQHPQPDKGSLQPTDTSDTGGHPPRRDCRADDGIAREHNQQQQHHPTCAHMTPSGDAQAGHTSSAWRQILRAA